MVHVSISVTHFVMVSSMFIISALIISLECDDETPSLEALVRSPSLPTHTGSHSSPTLWTIVMRMQNEIKSLKLDVRNLQLQLNEERQERTLAIAAVQTKNVFKDARESKC